MNRYTRWLKDPWIIFALCSAIIGIGLIVVPQIWILRASFQESGGKFHLKADAKTQTVTVIPETVERYALQEQSPGVYFVSRKNEPYFSIHSQGATRLRLDAAPGEQFSVNSDADNTIRLQIKHAEFLISQKVFFSFLDTQTEVTPLQVTVLSPRQLTLTYHPNAYLAFQDRHLHYTVNNYIHFFAQNRYLRAILNSLIVTLCSTVLASLIAVSLAYFLARYRIPGTPTILVLVTMASVAPPFLGAYAWRMLLGSYGILTRFFGLDWTIIGIHGVIWVITWLIFPVIFLLTYDAFTSIDHSLRESSMSLGADKQATLFKIEIPLAMPGIVTGLYLAMMAAFTDFGTPYVISIDLNVLPVLVYKEYMSEVGSNVSIASTGSILMIIISSSILMGQRIYLASRSYASVKSRQPSVMLPSPQKKRCILGFAAVVFVFAFLPHITVLITSFLEWKVGIVTAIPTLDNFARLISSELHSVFVSLFLGISATTLDFLFGIGIAYIIVRKRYPVLANFLNLLIMVPYLIPGTVLGIGFILIFNQPPILLTGTWIILVLAYFIRKLPYSVKSSEATLYQIHPALEEAAKSLGAKPLRSFRDVTLPLMLGGIISGASLSFLHIMTELSSTIILYRPPWKPMTAVIFENAISAGADFGVAGAMTVILMILLYLPLYIITRKTRKIKEMSIESI